MSVEVLLLAVACGITLLGYLVAINAHGPTRLSLSYLIATIMLAGTVWAIVQHVNSDLDNIEMGKLQKLEMEKQQAEERVKSQEEALRENKERMSYAARLNTIITTGTGFASSMINVDLQDRSADLETLMGRAVDLKKKTDDLKTEFEKLKTEDTFFVESATLMKEAIQNLGEAAYYWRSYYYSEDSEQEQLRERILRQKARAAYDRFQKATVSISPGSSSSSN